MRIALVSRELYPYSPGGIAPIVTATARLLAQIADVTVVTSGAYAGEHAELQAANDPRLLPDDVRVLFVEEPAEDDRGAAYSHMHAWSARVYAALREAYGDAGPDLIEFCDYLGEGFVTVQASHTHTPWLAGTLVCVRLHTTAEICNVLDGHVRDDFATTAVFDAERHALRHADRILWSGGDVLAAYQRFYGSDALAPAVRIPDAFLVETPTQAGGDSRPASGEPLRLLYLGRTERRKGAQNLLRALLALGGDDWQLTILGGDTKTAPLQTSVRAQLELMAAGDKRVVFAEPVPRHEVGAFIRAHDLVVVPSLWECWPNVAREAMMHNRPVLGTPVGGLTEMCVPGKSGWLAGDTSVEALTAELSRLRDDREEVVTMIDRGGPRAVFDELTDPARLLAGYHELLSTPRPRASRGPSHEPLVSVVVPYFRLERHIEETLDSVAAQSYPRIETILVNDGSLREEDRLLERLADRYPLRVVTQVNSGLGAARNLGISQSRGRYILPLDADDLLAPTFIERCVDALEANPDLAYVATWAQFMNGDGEPIHDDLGGYMPFGNWSNLIRRNNVGGTCSAVVRRRIFDRGFRYSTDLTSYEDWELYWAMHQAGMLGDVIPERLFHYRVREESMMRTVGSHSTDLIFGEIRAHVRERAMTWTAHST
jgi:glycogen(starch) synthase